MVASAATSSEDDLKSSIRSFSKVLSVVEENFADKVGPDKTVYKGAIPGMLRTLDPHSNFFDPKDFQGLRDDQRGHYFGVGMTIQPRDGKITVLAPFAGSPAAKAGIRPGDTIIEVNDKRTDNMNSGEVADLLKGPRNTPVQVKIARDGVDGILTFNIIRDEIPRKSVQDGFFVKPGVAYIRIESFNENTSRELEENMRRLGESSMRGLVLDLRANPGGLLNEGVAVGGRFLQRGQTVVSHRGRASTEKPYTARPDGPARDYPIVVLVNRFSASAAEIVAGALQDHDRGWILGENTFGKGLVQTVYPLSENTGLALTTARYYTPSDRLIQRDYKHTSFFDYYYRKNTNTQNQQDVKMTDAGRPVYGGGGIAPDEKYEAPKANPFQIKVIRKFAIQRFATKTFGDGKRKIESGWKPDQELMNEFHAYLMKENVEFTEADFAANNDWLKQQLQYEISLTGLGYEEAQRVAVEVDPMVERALEAMPKARALLDSAKKTIVQRLGR